MYMRMYMYRYMQHASPFGPSHTPTEIAPTWFPVGAMSVGVLCQIAGPPPRPRPPFLPTSEIVLTEIAPNSIPSGAISVGVGCQIAGNVGLKVNTRVASIQSSGTRDDHSGRESLDTVLAKKNEKGK